MRPVIPVVAYVVGFWLLWQTADIFTVAPHVSAFYPAPALSIAFIAMYGIKYAPAVFVAAALSTLPEHNIWEWGPQDFLQGCRQAAVYSLAGYALYRLIGARAPVLGSREVFSLLAVGVLASLVSTAFAAAIFRTFEVFPPEHLVEVFFSFWAGDAAGVVMALPLLYRLLFELRRRPVAEVVGMAAGMGWVFYAKAILVPMAFAGLGFGGLLFGEAGSNYGYLIVLPVVWLAASEGLLGGALAALAANFSAAAVYGRIGSHAYPAVELQVLFAVTAAIGLVVGAAFDERRAADEDRRQKERETAHLSRVAAIGELGATIAHEIATPLQTALVNSQLATELLDRKTPEDLDRLRSYTAQVQAAVETAATIHKRIHGFLRGAERAPTPTPVAEAVGAAVDLVAADVARSGIRLTVGTDGTDPRVRANPVEIQQVLINLIRNAQQAIDEVNASQKRIAVTLRSTGTGTVEIRVEDTGPGLPDGSVEALFSSFHSTREDGLGLGLSICRSIVQGYGGSIVAENAEQGARFVVRLPELEAGHES
jgi:signal transduction histidine kinase